MIGIFVSAPVGPVGVLCIRRALKYGWASGVVAGLGAALADSFYGAVASFGIVLISDFMLTHQFYLKILGGIILCAMGLKMIWTDYPKIDLSIPNGRNLKKNGGLSGRMKRYLAGDFAATFMMTFTNPGTIIAFLAIFAGVGFTDFAQKPISASMIVFGIFCGAVCWWGGLSWLIDRFDHHIDKNIKDKIHHISGGLILVFGALAFASLAL